MATRSAQPARRTRHHRTANGRRGIATLAGGAVAALALAGCGSHPATRADVIARGNAICSTANAAVRAVPSPTGSSDAALARYLSRVAPILTREATALGRLPRPAAQRATLDALIAAQMRDASGYRRLAAAARARDGAAVQSALSALGSSRASGLATRYGLSQCTGSAATVR